MPRVDGHEGPDHRGRNRRLGGSAGVAARQPVIQVFETAREVKPLGVCTNLLADIKVHGRQALAAYPIRGV